MNRLLTYITIATLTILPAVVHAQETEYDYGEVDVTTEGVDTSTSTYSGGSSYGSGSSNSGTAVGNFAVKIGPVGNFYIVDSNTQLDPGIGGFIAFDYRFHPRFSMEVGVMATLQDGTGISNGDNDIILFGLPTFDLKYYFLGESRWDPYALLGFGLYYLTEGSVNNGSAAFGVGANIGLGLDYYITSQFSVGMSAIFRPIAMIESVNGPNNGSAQFPFSAAANFAYHF